MKIRSASQVVEDLFPDAPPGKLEIENAPAEVRRVVKRLKIMLVSHFESASRLGIVPGADDVRSVMHALIAEADGLNPASHLECPDEIRHYFRRTIFDELVGEPSNVLYTTQINPEVVRYEAMPAEFWKQCIQTLLEELNAESGDRS